MSDEPQTNGSDPEAGAPIDENEAPPIMIGAQYIKDLSFENPQGPDVLTVLEQSPEVNIEVNTSARPLGDNVYEVTLFIRGEAVIDSKPVFIVELTYGGVASTNNVAEEDLQPLLLIEVPRHLFPFARSVIANVTRDGGFPPLMINPFDFALLYFQQHGETMDAEAPPSV